MGRPQTHHVLFSDETLDEPIREGLLEVLGEGRVLHVTVERVDSVAVLPDLDQRLAISGPGGQLSERESRSRFLPVSREISGLLLFVGYFASLNKGIKFGNDFSAVCCVN